MSDNNDAVLVFLICWDWAVGEERHEQELYIVHCEHHLLFVKGWHIPQGIVMLVDLCTHFPPYKLAYLSSSSIDTENKTIETWERMHLESSYCTLYKGMFRCIMYTYIKHWYGSVQLSHKSENYFERWYGELSLIMVVE